MAKTQKLDINVIGPENYFKAHLPLKATYHPTKDDLQEVLNQLYKKAIIEKLYFILFFSLGLASMVTIPPALLPFIKNILLIIGGLLCYYIIIPFLFSNFKMTRIRRDKFNSRPPEEFTFDKNGIRVKTEKSNIQLDWDMIQSIGLVDRFVYFHGAHKTESFFLSLSSFASNEDRLSLQSLIKEVYLIKEYFNRKNIRNLYYFGILGLIPVFGVFAGAAILSKKVPYRDKWLTVIGTIDILITAFVFYFHKELGLGLKQSN